MRISALVLLLGFCTTLAAQEGVLRGRIDVEHQLKKNSDNSDAIVSLIPYGEHAQVQPGPIVRLVQKNKQFVPRMLAITEGTTVEFPNRDPFFHDVFSIYHGRPFDLGLYESGAARKIAFTKPGVSYIFCNIHPEMSAIIVVLSTPYFAQTNADGSFQIAHLPPGRYKLKIWHEFASPAELSSLAKDIEVAAGGNTLAAITLHSSDVVAHHLNKYGEAYSPDKALY